MQAATRSLRTTSRPMTVHHRCSLAGQRYFSSSLSPTGVATSTTDKDSTSFDWRQSYSSWWARNRAQLHNGQLFSGFSGTVDSPTADAPTTTQGSAVANKETEQLPIIDFGKGVPPNSLMPWDLISSAMANLGGAPENIMGYAPAQQIELVDHLASWLKQEIKLEDHTNSDYVPIDANQLQITNGCSQALSMISDLFTSNGDTILVENPTYMYALDIFRDKKLNPVSVNTDSEGIVLDDLIEKVQIANKTNQQPPLLYIVPAFNNPTGITLSDARRRQLVELTRTHNFTIIADEVYQFLYFSDTNKDNMPPPPMFCYTNKSPQDRVIGINSFSKILAPGLGLGWIHTSENNIQRFKKCGLMTSGGGPNPVTSHMAASVLSYDNGRTFSEHVSKLRGEYAARRNTLCSQLTTKLANSGKLRFATPLGGYFVWLEVTNDSCKDTKDLLKRCQETEAGVGFKPGYLFASSNEPHMWNSYMRLSFASYSPEEITMGVDRLVQIL